ncbi:hypothetical protein B0T13DRAFT_64108 [Neurospora crassa]|nr:hypothetical protein B0T13DRAFT_64108 [Neurospora crassa]
MDNAPTGLQKLFPKAIVAKRRDRRRRRSSLAESASLSSTGSIGTDDAVSVPIPVPGFRLQSTSASQAQAQTRRAGSSSRSPAPEGDRGSRGNTDDNTNNNNINTDSEYPDSQPLSTPVPYESTPDPDSASAPPIFQKSILPNQTSPTCPFAPRPCLQLAPTASSPRILPSELTQQLRQPTTPCPKGSPPLAENRTSCDREKAAQSSFPTSLSATRALPQIPLEL